MSDDRRDDTDEPEDDFSELSAFDDEDMDDSGRQLEPIADFGEFDAAVDGLDDDDDEEGYAEEYDEFEDFEDFQEIEVEGVGFEVMSEEEPDTENRGRIVNHELEFDIPEDDEDEETAPGALSALQGAAGSVLSQGREQLAGATGPGDQADPPYASDDFDDDVRDIDDFDEDIDDQDIEDDELQEQDDLQWSREQQDDPPMQTLPWGLLAAGVIAVLLVAAGGYGVIQDRAALQEEIRRLQSRIATAAPPEEVQSARQSLREMEQANADLELSNNALQTDNRALRETVRGLENQLNTVLAQARESAETRAATSTAPAPTAASPATTRPARTAPAPAASAGDWFVNFGSYGNEAIAREWAGRLRVSSGRVIVMSLERSNGTLFRVRIVDIPSKADARAVARELESKYSLPRLWVGEQ